MSAVNVDYAVTVVSNVVYLPAPVDAAHAQLTVARARLLEAHDKLAAARDEIRELDIHDPAFHGAQALAEQVRELMLQTVTLVEQFDNRGVA